MQGFSGNVDKPDLHNTFFAKNCRMQPAVELEFRLELQCKSSTQLARVVIGEFYA
jgi:hypothetical protein